ncbi:MAG: macro domain-containing protein [Chloroflexota bacterium]
MQVLTLSRGNLLEANAEALVNTVNCVGVMGKGVALQFKQAFPQNFSVYQRACRQNEVQPGRMLIVPTTGIGNPKYIINFPTKRHWKARSLLTDISSGLDTLVEDVRRLGIRSIAVPPLGCGNGGLDWRDVEPLIRAALEQLPDVHALVFEPHDAPTGASMPVRTNRPIMTRARALLLLLLAYYRGGGYRSTLLEVQKLAYFLQAAGEPLQLDYGKHKYGPYAENLNHALQRIEGHFIRGYGDRSQRAEIQLMPGALEEAECLLGEDYDVTDRLQRVSRLIEGFATPYGMELLATVHWVASESPNQTASDGAVVQRVQEWSARKGELFTAQHIAIALTHLGAEGWLPPDQADPVLV